MENGWPGSELRLGTGDRVIWEQQVVKVDEAGDDGQYEAAGVFLVTGPRPVLVAKPRNITTCSTRLR